MFREFQFELNRRHASDQDWPHHVLHLASELAMHSIGLAGWHADRSRQRQTLRDLDYRRLADTAVARAAALREAEEWFWR